MLQDGCAQTLSALACTVSDMTGDSCSGVPESLLQLLRADRGQGETVDDGGMLVIVYVTPYVLNQGSMLLQARYQSAY